MALDRAAFEKMAVRVKHACHTGKVGHFSEARAAEEAVRMSSRPPRYGPRIAARAYLCRSCGLWHIGRPRGHDN